MWITTLSDGTPNTLWLFAGSPNHPIQLTMQQANARLPEPSPAWVPKAVDDPGRVLLVEDDDSVRKSMVRLLNSLGVLTASYASAEALLAAIRTAIEPKKQRRQIRLPPSLVLRRSEKE